MAKNNEQTPEETNTLTDYQWDEVSEESFFGIKVAGAATSTEESTEDDEENEAPENLDNPKVPAKKKAAAKETEGETEEEGKKKKVKKGGEEDEPEPFSDTTTTETEGNQEPTQEDEDKKFFTTLTSELKEKGILRNIELKENEEITEEKFFEIQDEEIESRVEETVQGLIDEIGQEGTAYIKFIKAGGKTDHFFSTMRQVSAYPKVDITTEEGQNQILTYYLREVAKLEEEDVQDRLEWLTENNRKEKYATKYFTQLESQARETEKRLLKEAEDAKKARESNKKAFVSEVSTVLQKTEQIKGFNLSQKDKKELVNYIANEEAYVLPNGKKISALWNDINKVLYGEDRTKLLLLAKILKSDFDFSDLVTNVQTKVVEKTRSTLAAQKQGLNPSSSKSRRSDSLIDIFS